MATRKRNTQNETTAKTTDDVVCRFKANPARGEVAMVINGKHCLFVPSFENIVRIEERTNKPVIEIVAELSRGRFMASQIIPLLTLMNEGDHVSDEEMYRWIMGEDDKPLLMEKLSAIAIGVIDPNGKRFQAMTKEEAEASPNG